MKKTTIIILCLFMMTLITSCRKQPSNAFMALSYNVASQGNPKRNIKVGLVKPKHSSVETPLIKSPIFNYMGRVSSSPEFSVPAKLNTTYMPTFIRSTSVDIGKILKSKGIDVYDTYSTIDEIPYAAKKKLDLIVSTEISLTPHVTNRRDVIPLPFKSKVINNGIIQLHGDSHLSLIEPLSGEKIIIKNIDFSDVCMSNCSIRYGSTKEAHEKLAKLLQDFYPKFLEKISRVLDADEIERAMSDIRHLKAKNL